MRQAQKMKNIFSDKATIIPRKMLQDPQREWVVRDFTGPGGISLGMAQSVLEAMARKGYVERVKRGPDSHTVLTNKDMLITNWLREYQFELNTVDSYYSTDKEVLGKVKFTPNYLNTEDTAKYIKEMYQYYGEVVKKFGITLEK